ncbi:MAG TPA: phosphoribosylglycinamide formyltransferase [Steroidobacteraceae bacterium]|nr:phosphoribosylglycinamide formyltransferase [Steroidobacteraceae bacterium]
MTGSDPLRLAILISGRGSNMAAIARACAAGRINARVDLVLSERSGVAGLDTARALGIEARTVAWPGTAGRMQFECDLDAALTAARPDVIVLAGFMRILSQQFVEARAGRMLNIHPSLLPNYRGLHTHRRVLEAGDQVHGASVHFVTAELDGGPLILQSRVAVRPGDTEDTLSARVQATEHSIYPQVIGWLAAGRLAWRDGRPWLDGKPLDAPLVEDFPLQPIAEAR